MQCLLVFHRAGRRGAGTPGSDQRRCKSTRTPDIAFLPFPRGSAWRRGRPNAPMQCFLVFPRGSARRGWRHGHTRTALMQCFSVFPRAGRRSAGAPGSDRRRHKGARTLRVAFLPSPRGSARRRWGHGHTRAAISEKTVLLPRREHGFRMRRGRARRPRHAWIRRKPGSRLSGNTVFECSEAARSVPARPFASAGTRFSNAPGAVSGKTILVPRREHGFRTRRGRARRPRQSWFRGKPGSGLGGNTVFKCGEAARGVPARRGFGENHALARAGTRFSNAARPRAAPL